jgi:hypothetical protein
MAPSPLSTASLSYQSYPHPACSRSRRARSWFQHAVAKVDISNRLLSSYNFLMGASSSAHDVRSSLVSESVRLRDAVLSHASGRIDSLLRRHPYRVLTGQEFQSDPALPVPPISEFAASSRGSCPPVAASDASFNAYVSAESVAVPLELGRLSLPTAGAQAVDFCSVCPSLAAQYSLPQSPGLLNAQAADRQGRSAGPGAEPPPRIYLRNQADYPALVNKLVESGTVVLTSERPVVMCGLFGVMKDDNTIRVIWDCRRSNTRFQPSPKVDLPSPEILASLQLREDERIFVGKEDVSQYYHRLLLPVWMRRYFGLPPVMVDGQLLYPVARTLPMGFSHSVYIAETFHRHLVFPSVLPASAELLSVSALPSFAAVDDVFVLLYIDDAIFLGRSREAVARVQDAYRVRLRSVGLAIHPSKSQPPTLDPVKCLGFMVDGGNGRVELPQSTESFLLVATKQLLREGRCTGRAMFRLLGHWTWACMLARPALSVLRHCYRFAMIADKRSFSLWPSVRLELQVLVGLLPLLFRSLRVPWRASVFATDASQKGLGVCLVNVPVHSVRTLASSWPFSPPTSISPVSNPSGAAYALAAPVALPPPPPAPLSLGQAVPLFRSHSFHTVISARWRFQAHINQLECHAILTALRRALSSSFAASRLLMLTDSAVVHATLRKGRCRSPGLLNIYRKIAALSLATGVRVLSHWIPSHLNPADGPSRFFS